MATSPPAPGRARPSGPSLTERGWKRDRAEQVNAAMRVIGTEA